MGFVVGIIATFFLLIHGRANAACIEAVERLLVRFPGSEQWSEQIAVSAVNNFDRFLLLLDGSMVLVSVAAVDAVRLVPATGGRPLGVECEIEVFRPAPTADSEAKWSKNGERGWRRLGWYPSVLPGLQNGVWLCSEGGAVYKAKTTVTVTARFEHVVVLGGCTLGRAGAARLWSASSVAATAFLWCVPGSSASSSTSETKLQRARQSGSRSRLVLRPLGPAEMMTRMRRPTRGASTSRCTLVADTWSGTKLHRTATRSRCQTGPSRGAFGFVGHKILGRLQPWRSREQPQLVAHDGQARTA